MTCCSCNIEDPCGECDYGRRVYGPDTVIVYTDTRTIITYNGNFRCGTCLYGPTSKPWGYYE